MGKTTTAEALVPLLDGGRLFDPEQVGFLLRQSVPVPTGDFQDRRAWRRLTVQTAVALVDALHRQSSGPVRLVVPMTLTDPSYRAEIFGGLARHGLAVHEVVLTAAAEVLEARVEADVLFPDDPERNEAARRWRWEHRHQARHLEGLVPPTHCIDTSTPSPSEVASLVAGSLSRGGTDRGQVSPKARSRSRVDRAADA